MQVIGTKQEIKWAKEALLNCCEDCPYILDCNRTAMEEQKKEEKVEYSCGEYLSRMIEFITI